MRNFEFVRYAINPEHSAPNLDELDWDELYDFAKKQSISGVIFLGVSRLRQEGYEIPRKIWLKWYMLNEMIGKRNAELNQLCIEVSAKFLEKGVHSCILKGQGNAQMYPIPEARMSGDIDIWLDGEIGRLVKMVRQKRPKAKACYHHIDYGKYKGVSLEIHYRPAYINNLIYNGRLQRWFREMSHEQMTHRIVLQNCSEEISVPTVAFNRIFQMAHISNHIIQEGIGLRQLLDYYYLLKQGFSEEERQRDEQLLRRFGLYHVASAVMYVLREVFGLTAAEMIVPADEQRGQFLLDEIMLAGNFGMYDKRLEGNHTAFAKNMARLRRDVSYLRYFPSECLWEPVFRIYHFFWRLSHR